MEAGQKDIRVSGQVHIGTDKNVVVHGDIELTRMPTNKTASIDAPAAVDIVLKPGAGVKEASVTNFAHIDESQTGTGKSVYIKASDSAFDTLNLDTDAARMTLTGIGEASYRPEMGRWTTEGGTEEEPKMFIADKSVKQYHVKATGDFAGNTFRLFELRASAQ